MFNKINLVGAVVLLLLGILLAIGYPRDGVKSNIQQTLNQKEGNYTPVLTREGNAKNFEPNIENSSDNNAEVKSSVHKTTSGIHKVKPKTAHKAVVKTKQPTKKIIQKPIKKKVTLTPPPPPKKEEEEEDDEGC